VLILSQFCWPKPDVRSSNPFFCWKNVIRSSLEKKHPSIQTQGVGIILRQKKTNLMFLAFAISSGQSFLLRNGGDPKGARHCGNNPFFENLFYLEFGKKP